MKGYYKMPEESAAVLKNGWLYTGDLARMDEEGYFFIVDRKSLKLIDFLSKYCIFYNRIYYKKKEY